MEYLNELNISDTFIHQYRPILIVLFRNLGMFDLLSYFPSTERVDSKGFRILSDQVHDFTQEPLDVIARILRNSVIYNDRKLMDTLLLIFLVLRISWIIHLSP